MNGNDPTGLQIVVTQDPSVPNRYYVDFNNVYFTGTANSAAFQNRYINVTQDRLTGVFGGYEIITSVSLSPGNAPSSSGIRINVLPGSNLGQDADGRRVLGNAGFAPAGVNALLSADLPVQISSDNITHENFHLIAPTADFARHNHPGSNIMNSSTPGVPRSVTEQNFNDAFSARGVPGIPGSSNVFGTDNGAANGFLIYPNTSNNNGIRSVYTKP